VVMPTRSPDTLTAQSKPACAGCAASANFEEAITTRITKAEVPVKPFENVTLRGIVTPFVM